MVVVIGWRAAWSLRLLLPQLGLPFDIDLIRPSVMFHLSVLMAYRDGRVLEFCEHPMKPRRVVLPPVQRHQDEVGRSLGSSPHDPADDSLLSSHKREK